MDEGAIHGSAALERILSDRLNAVAGAGGDRWAGEAEDLRDLALDSVPLVLLGAGAAHARGLVAHALAHWNVVGIVDNPRAGTVEDGRTILGDVGLVDLLGREPRAVGVMCCGSDGGERDGC